MSPHRNHHIMGLLSVTLLAIDGSANTTTIYLNPDYIIRVRPASATEITNFPTALTSITIKDLTYQSPVERKYLTATATATVASAIASAQSGVLGSGVSGQTTLVAGTKAITITGLTTSSLAFVQLVTPNTASSTIQYKAVCTANTLTITALVAAGTINASDVSTVNYAILG